MSQYTCRIYRNSGFNAVNIPDSPALLDSLGNYVDCYALDLNQERFLPIVKIRGDWASVKDTDYCKVGDFFYFVDDVQMIAGDVAQLTLTPDFITSAGGPGALEILDGVTDRVHVTNDTFGLYGADDPYMAPALDMDIDSYTQDFYSTEFSPTGARYYTFLETTLDLGNMGDKNQRDVVEALTCTDLQQTDPDGNHPYVAVPIVDYILAGTEYDLNLFGSTKKLTSVKGQGVYLIDDTQASTQIKSGIALARALGIDECISAQYSIPEEFVTVATGQVATQFCTKITGKSFNFPVSVPFVYGSAHNNRIWYGSYSPYMLTAGSGSSVSVNAEEIYNGETYPKIAVLADPRRGGKPYFRFNPLNDENVLSNPLDFFRGAIAGKEWQNVPMVMNSKSGGLLDQVRYKNSRDSAAIDWAHNEENVNRSYWGAIGGQISSAAGGVSQAFNGDAIGGLATIGAGTLGAVIEATDINRGRNQYIDKYNYQRALDQQELKIAMNIHAPEVHFPLDPNLFAEITGNGVTVARAVYKQADISRIDKILTAYGYKYAKVLEASDFTNRTYFNYVSGSITVGNLPRWWADGISAQIGTGVRVWHVKPNHSYYSNNPIRS